MFALTGDEPEPKSVNLKCDPDDGLALRNQFDGVHEGYHMDHRHWITVDLNSDVPDGLLYELINDSYDLVVAKLPKKDREALKTLQTIQK
jgi:predicted DNA-binding protein (MmcQ/YjbR family)